MKPKVADQAAQTTVVLERIPLGGEWEPAHRDALSAIDNARSTLASVVFEDLIKPRSADDLSQYVFHSQRARQSSIVEEFAEFHRRSLSTSPGLAEMFRTRDALDDIREASTNALVTVPPSSDDSPSTQRRRASDIAIERYQHLIMEQLAQAAGHPLASIAKEYLSLDELRTRVAAARAKHEAHAIAERDRLTAEQRAASDRLAAAEDAKELEAEIARVQRTGIGLVNHDERDRLALLVTVRRRLRTSKVESIRIGRNVYGPIDLSYCVGSYTIEDLRDVSDALDRAERGMR